MTTRICIRLNDQEQAAFARIKGRLNDAEGFRMLLRMASDQCREWPNFWKSFSKDKAIKTSTRNGRHVGNSKP